MLTRQRKTALLLSWMLAARKRQSPSKHAFSSRRRFVRTRVAAHRQFTPATFDKLDSKLTEWEFKRTFRLSRTVFNEVHGRIEHRLQCNETQRSAMKLSCARRTHLCRRRQRLQPCRCNWDKNGWTGWSPRAPTSATPESLAAERRHLLRRVLVPELVCGGRTRRQNAAAERLQNVQEPLLAAETRHQNPLLAAETQNP